MLGFNVCWRASLTSCAKIMMQGSPLSDFKDLRLDQDSVMVRSSTDQVPRSVTGLMILTLSMRFRFVNPPVC